MLIPILILSVAAQIQVNGNFRRYSAVRNRRGLTGAQAAEAVLRTHGVTDVAIRPVRGSLTDHYDPRDNTIYLSETVYAADTVAAVGVAAHEAGHAVQYAEGYAPVRLRSAIVSVTNLSSQASMVLLFIGLLSLQPDALRHRHPAVLCHHIFPTCDAAGGVQCLPPGHGYH